MNAAGYPLYLAFIFLPGIGLGELLNVFSRRDSLIERLALALGIGLSVDSIVLFVRTSGAVVGGVILRGIDIYTVYSVILVGLILVAASTIHRRKLTLYVRPVWYDLAVFLIMLGLTAMIVAYFSKYPIFPEYQSEDFASHVGISTGLISGASSSFPGGILYDGVEYQLASAILLVGGNALVAVRVTMSIVVLLSLLPVFLAASTLFSSKVAGVLVTAVYAFSGTLWFDAVFNTGLYANFFGILASLFLLTAFFDVSDSPKSRRTWAYFVLILSLAYLSHYSTITVIPAILVTGVILFLDDQHHARRNLLSAVVPLIPVAFFAIFFPNYISTVVALATGGGGDVTGSTSISNLLTSFPFLQYLALEVYDDLALIVLFILAGVYAYRMAREKKWPLLLPLVWFGAVLLTSPENINAWRFSFTGILPLILISGQGIVYLFPKSFLSPRKKGQSARKTAKPQAIITSVVVVLLLVVGSWGTTMLSDSASNAGLSSQTQHDVYQAILWLDNNTATNSSYLSVSDWRFTLTYPLIDRFSFYQFESTPASALTLARSEGAGYIIVTNLVTASVPPIPSLFPWNNFNSPSNMSLVFANSDVEIFKVLSQ